MKRCLFGFMFVILLLLLAGCSPSPKSLAEAHEITVLADAQAAQDAHDLAVQIDSDALDLEIRKARKVEVIESWRIFIKLVGLVATAASIYVVFYMGKATADTVQGLGRAAVMAAEVKALQIHLDEDTRTFPLLMRPIHNTGKFLLHDPNTNSSTVLDMNNPVDRQLAAGSGVVKLAGAVARESRQAEDATGVSLAVNAPVIEVVDDGEWVWVGQNAIAEVQHG